MSFLNVYSEEEDPDEELASQYKASGDMNILGQLYKRYMDLVYGVCLKYFKDPEKAKDAVMAIFEELVTKLLKHEVHHFKAWLHQLSRNYCLMELRAGKKFTKVDMDISLMQNEEELHLNGVMEKEEHFKQLEYCMSQLVQEQKKVIELFYLQQKCYQEIVSLTGMEWNKVRSFIQNGRRNLKLCMDRQLNN
ncbi:MAG: sigma-70 family RNA polymerase sigma factor [Ferruginibacter sp.]